MYLQGSPVRESSTRFVHQLRGPHLKVARVEQTVQRPAATDAHHSGRRVEVERCRGQGAYVGVRLASRAASCGPSSHCA
jgi:hypothetical protein